MEEVARITKQWNLACHLAAFIGFVIPFGNILGPLVVWLFKKDEFPSVEVHGKESLNFQISITLYVIISLLLMIILIGIALLVIIVILQIVLVITAALKADKGEVYRYPLSIRFIK